MNLRPTILNLAAVCLLALPFVCAAGEKPNIVVIMADALGWRDLHCFGNPQLDTPALDQFAAEGRYRACSIIGSEFECGIESLTSVGDKAAIVPTVSGRAWIMGTHQLMLDPDDPWPEGYRVTDTWPGL